MTIVKARQKNLVPNRKGFEGLEVLKRETTDFDLGKSPIRYCVLDIKWRMVLKSEIQGTTSY